MISSQESPRTMFDKIWDRHEITKPFEDGPSLLYIDRDIIHEGSFHAFSDLKKGYVLKFD